MNKLNLSKITQAVLVTYNPDIPLLIKNLTALNRQFENILLVDNSSQNIDQIEKITNKVNPHITIKKLSENMGIASAFNEGYKAAKTKRFQWLLTMDQDSVLPDNFSEEYEKIIQKYDNIGLIAWNQRPHKLGSGDEIEKDWYIISSGCLNNMSAMIKCGGFDEKLFIDHVDTDLNIRIRNLGYRTITTNKVKLIHEIGKATDKRTMRGSVYHEHSPVRVYYIVRNGVVLFRRYFLSQPAWMLRALKNSVREGMYLLRFQPNKFRNFLIVSRAWFDGIFNRLGKYRY